MHLEAMCKIVIISSGVFSVVLITFLDIVYRLLEWHLLQIGWPSSHRKVSTKDHKLCILCMLMYVCIQAFIKDIFVWCVRPRRLVIFYLKCTAYKSTYLLSYVYKNRINIHKRWTNVCCFQPAEKLAILTRYLRSTHCYCVWCGTAFDGSLFEIFVNLLQ